MISLPFVLLPILTFTAGPEPAVKVTFAADSAVGSSASLIRMSGRTFTGMPVAPAGGLTNITTGGVVSVTAVVVKLA